MKIKQQYYLVISHVGSMSSYQSKSEISDQDMELSKIVRKVLNATLAYGFFYKIKQYTIVNDTKFFSEENKTIPFNFNFIDPVAIYLFDGNLIIKTRNSWADYPCNESDNIIFSSDEKKRCFKSSCEHSLNIITI